MAPDAGDFVTRDSGPRTEQRPWVFADLTDDELRAFFEQECSCRTPEQSGTRNGYTCPPHRAQRELDRRYPNRADQW